MAKLAIGIGQEFPIEERSADETCREAAQRYAHYYHHWQKYLRHRAGTPDAPPPPKTEEPKE